MQVDNNWYWYQQPKQHVITVPTLTILHPQFEVNAVKHFHTISTTVYTRKKAKKVHIKTAYIFG